LGDLTLILKSIIIIIYLVFNQVYSFLVKKKSNVGSM